MASPKVAKKAKKTKAPKAKKEKKEKKPNVEGEDEKKRKRSKRSFGVYISRVNKKGKNKRTLSSKSVKVLNSFCYDMFDQLATTAGSVARKAKPPTIPANAMSAAVRLTLPAALAKHAIAEAQKACANAVKNAPPKKEKK